MAVLSGNDRIFDVLSRDGNVVVIDPPKLDLESYIQNYSGVLICPGVTYVSDFVAYVTDSDVIGRTRFERLFFVGQHSVSLCIDALKAAVLEAKRGRDTGHYRLAQEKLAAVAPHEPEALPDKEWMDRVLRENNVQTKRLEDELKGYKNNLIKESVRMGNEDLGNHYLEIGELDKSYDAFNRMRQDVIVQKHIVDISRHLMAVCIEQGKWVTVQSNAQKIMAVAQSVEDEKAIQPYLKICMGLANLAEGKYHDTAISFLSVDSGMGITYNDTASPNDIAVYGGLCALASMDRDELQQRVLDNSNFRTYLELEPHIRRAVTFFVNGRYSACLSTLESYRNDYLLDIYLQRHITEIYHQIRSKSIIQYFIPFSCVTLESMDTAFGGPGLSLEKELVDMIQRRTLVARIDKQNKLLTSVPSLPRAALQSETLASAKAYEREMRHRLQRMNILGAGLEVRSTKKSQGPGQGPASGVPLGDILYATEGRGTRSRGFLEGFGNDSGYE